MSDLEYFTKKARQRINLLLYLCLIVIVVCFFVSLKRDAEGFYDQEGTPWIILIAGAIGTVVYLIVFNILLKLASISQTWTAVVIVLTLPMGLFYFWPMIKYHRGDSYDDIVDDRVFKATVKAYQKAWARQCWFQRIGIPILLVAALYGIYQLIIYFEATNPNVLMWIGIIVCVILFLFTLYLIGGVRDVRRTYDTYEASVGTTMFDYGEVTWHKTNSVTKDETDISLVAVIISIALIPIEAMLVVALILVFVLVQVIRMLLPVGGRHSIYLHKRKIGINPMYMPFSESFLNVIMMYINRALGLIFSINIVNDDFWTDGVGPNYICENLSNRNMQYLEKLLEKVENKYGYYHYF